MEQARPFWWSIRASPESGVKAPEFRGMLAG